MTRALCVAGMREHRSFLRAAVRNPRRIGAIAPSSRRLSALMASVVPATGRPVIVELGPGTGAVSALITDRLPVGGRHLAVELDPHLAADLARRHPTVEVITGDVRDLDRLLAERGVTSVDAVVGGLPWSLFDADSQHRILRRIADILAPGGAFTTFAYTHTGPMRGARSFRGALEAVFEEVQISRTVWRNAPPAFGYICRRPRPDPPIAGPAQQPRHGRAAASPRLVDRAHPTDARRRG